MVILIKGLKSLKNKLVLSLLFTFIAAPVFAQTMDHAHMHNHTKIQATKNDKNAKLKVILSPNESSYPKLKPIKFTLNVSQNNKAIEKASITMDLTMPDMSMPKNEITFKEVSKGTYEAEGIFTMSGDWVLVVSINHNGKKEIKNFNIVVG